MKFSAKHSSVIQISNFPVIVLMHCIAATLFTPVFAGEDTKTPEYVLDEYAKAKGGREKLDAVETLKITREATFEDSKNIVRSVIFATRDGKKRYEVYSDDVHAFTIISDTENIWRISSEGGQDFVEPLGREALANYTKITIGYFSNPHDLIQKGEPVTRLADKTIEDEAYAVLEVQDVTSTKTHLFFNAKTWLLDRADIFDENDELSETTYFLDYSASDQILYPTLVKSTYYEEGIEFSQSVTVRTHVNPAIEESVFKAP